MEFRTLLTVGDAIRAATRALAATSATAARDTDVLVRHASGVTQTDAIAHPERLLSEAACVALASLIERRVHGEPIAYLIGRREFWSLDLAVSPAVLIPRPETELLVERALAHIPPSADWTIADLGTGSGAVALAIARERPHATVIATDQSDAALAIARENAQRLGIANVEFRRGDWLAPFRDQRVQLIASNPPYLRADDPHLNEGDVRFEPHAALVAGPSGLEAIREIVSGAGTHLLPGGWLLLEHGFDQAGEVRALLETHGYDGVRCYKDLAGHERVAEARAL